MPLVHGKTRILAEGGRVGLLDCVESMDLGTAQPAAPVAERAYRAPLDQGYHRFLSSFQWLPCEVGFRAARKGEGQSPASAHVEIHSYINNVHPRRHQQLCGVLETVLELAIQSWDEVLIHREKACGEVHFQARLPMRIRTFGAQWNPDLPAWAEGLETVERETPAYKEALANVCTYLEQPDKLFSEPVLDIETFTAADVRSKPYLNLSSAVKRKYARIRHPVHPEPGRAFSYEEWKHGKVRGAVVPPREDAYTQRRVSVDHTYYTISLQDMFQDKGLQVVVDIGDISLLPGDPP